MTPKALKLHLQSIKLQNSFYSSNFLLFYVHGDVVIRKISGFFVLVLGFVQICNKNGGGG
jgi:hypothetical protein